MKNPSLNNNNKKTARCLILSIVSAFFIVVFIPAVFFDFHIKFGIVFQAIAALTAPVLAILLFKICQRTKA
jgi:hypothetical protein